MIIFWRQLKLYFQKNWRLLLVLFSAALLWRVAYLLTHVSFTQDQVRDVLLIRNFIASKNFYIPLGPAAASYSNFNVLPLYYYLQLLAQLVFGNTFYAMSVLTMLLESTTPIMLFYLLTKVGLKRKISFLGALLYVFTPGAITLAVSAWNPNLVPFFTIILLIGGLWFLLENRIYGLLIAILAMVFLVNLHFQWFVILPFVLIIGAKALWQIKKTWKTLLLGILLGSLFLSPYLYFEVTHHWQNLRASIDFATNGPVVFERISKPIYLLFFFPNYYNRLFFGEKMIYHWTWLYEGYRGPELKLVLNSIVFWFIFILNSYLALRHWHQKNGKWLASTLAIFVMMAAVLRFYKGDKPDYFLNIFMVFIFVWLMQAINCLKKWKWQVMTAIGLIVISNWILWSKPWFNQYRNFKIMSDQIKEIQTEKQILILNQELEKPVRYFLEDENFVATPAAKIKNTIFICYASQNCASFLPNVISNNNIFKYDLVTPVNYGISFENYDSWSSGGWQVGDLGAFKVVTNL